MPSAHESRLTIDNNFSERTLRLHDDDPLLGETLLDRWANQHPEAVLSYWLEESRRKAAARSIRRRHARAVSRPR